MARRHAWLLGIIALTAVLLSRNITDPWIGETAFNGAWISSCARNLLRYAPGDTWLLQIRNDAFAAPDDFHYYVHHPPGVVWLVAISFILFGVSEPAARLIPITFTLLTTLLLYRCVCRWRNRGAANIAALTYALMPMTGRFGHMVNHEPITQFWILLTLYAYARFLPSSSHAAPAGGDAAHINDPNNPGRRAGVSEPRRRPEAHWRWIMFGSFICGTLCGWPAYYLAAILPFHQWIRVLRSHVRKQHRADPSSRDKEPKHHSPWILLGLPACAAMMMCLTVLHVYAGTGSKGVEVMARAFAFRSFWAGYETYVPPDNFVRSGGQPLTLGTSHRSAVGAKAFVLKQAWRATLLFSPIALLAVLVWLIMSLGRRGPRDPSDGTSIIIPALFAVGIIHALLFHQGAWDHDYWIYYLGLPMAMALALTFDQTRAANSPVAPVSNRCVRAVIPARQDSSRGCSAGRRVIAAMNTLNTSDDSSSQTQSSDVTQVRGQSTWHRWSLRAAALALAAHCAFGWFMTDRYDRTIGAKDRFAADLGRALAPHLKGRPAATTGRFLGPMTAYYAHADIEWEVPTHTALQDRAADGKAIFYLSSSDTSTNENSEIRPKSIPANAWPVRVTVGNHTCTIVPPALNNDSRNEKQAGGPPSRSEAGGANSSPATVPTATFGF